MTAALLEKLCPRSVQSFDELIIHARQNNNNAETIKGREKINSQNANLLTLLCKQAAN